MNDLIGVIIYFGTALIYATLLFGGIIYGFIEIANKGIH